MATNVSTLSVLISANSSQFTGAIAKMGTSVKGIAERFINLKTVGLGMAAGFAAASGAAIYFTKQSMDSLDAMAKLGNRLDISTKTLAGLQLYTDLGGVAFETLTKGIGKMQVQLGQARMGVDASSEAFSKLGISADTIANGSTEEVFFQVTDAIAAIPDKATQSATAFKIFGKSGAELINVLGAGSEEMRKHIDLADKMGLGKTEEDIAKVEAANDALTMMGKVLEGVFNTIAVEVSPWVTALANQLTEMGMSANDGGKWVVTALDGVVTAVAFAADTFDLLVSGWYAFSGAARTAVGYVLNAQKPLFEAWDWLLSKLGLIEKGSLKAFSAMGDAMHEAAKEDFAKSGKSFESFMRGDKSRAVKGFADTIKAGYDKAAKDMANKPRLNIDNEAAKKAMDDQEEIEKVLEGLTQKTKEFGKTENELTLEKLKQLGIDEDRLKQAELQLATLDKMKAAEEQRNALEETRKKNLEDLQGFVDGFDFTTPLERFNAQIEKLNEAAAAGLVDPERYGMIRTELQKTLDEELASSKGETQGPSLLRAGSAAAQRFVFEQGQQKDTVQEKQLTVQEQTRDEMRMINKNFRTIGEPISFV